MTNIERANKWHEIMELLNDIYYRQTTTLNKRLVIAHYLVFATETWLMYLDKAMRENYPVRRWRDGNPPKRCEASREAEKRRC